MELALRCFEPEQSGAVLLQGANRSAPGRLAARELCPSPYRMDLQRLHRPMRGPRKGGDFGQALRVNRLRSARRILRTIVLRSGTLGVRPVKDPWEPPKKRKAPSGPVGRVTIGTSGSSVDGKAVPFEEADAELAAILDANKKKRS